MTIPTTSNAIVETPANTPRPIGNTSNFFPGGLNAVDTAPAFSALGVGGKVGDGEFEDWSKGTVGDGGVSVGGSVLSGCGVSVGFGTDEIPYQIVRIGGFYSNIMAHDDHYRHAGR